MQVIPLLFINNWPAPSVEAIYRADCCFDKECKLLERALVYTAEDSVFIKLLTSCWFSFAHKHRSDITAGVNVYGIVSNSVNSPLHAEVLRTVLDA